MIARTAIVHEALQKDGRISSIPFPHYFQLYYLFFLFWGGIKCIFPPDSASYYFCQEFTGYYLINIPCKVLSHLSVKIFLMNCISTSQRQTFIYLNYFYAPFLPIQDLQGDEL